MWTSTRTRASSASPRSRAAQAADAGAIARVYNEGIEDRLATFETEPRSADDVVGWLDAGFPLVVVEDGHEVVAWASAPPYSDRKACEGVRDFSVYVARERRGHGFGKLAMEALAAECGRRGYWKLVSRVFPENQASLALCRALGFRDVGVYHRHAKLDGEWRDCLIVELLLSSSF